MDGAYRQVQQFPVTRLRETTDKVINMEALGQQDDRAGPGVVQPARHGAREPVMDLLPHGLGGRILSLHRIVDDQDVTAPPRQGASNGGRDPASLQCRVKLIDGTLVRVKFGPGERRAIKRAPHEIAGLAPEILR